MTATDKFYQHEHERISSRSLRHTSSGTAGSSYNSCEAIGVVPPRPPDTTYGNGGIPTNPDYGISPVGAILYTGGQITIPDATGTYIIPAGLGIYALTVAGAFISLGYIIDSWNDGSFTHIMTSDCRVRVATDLTSIYGVIMAYMPTPNVLITYPCMVNVEFSTGTIGKELCEVKVYRRDESWHGSLQHITLDTGLTLPCMLEPGWYAFKAQSTNWADHALPSTDKTNGDAIPFVITLERPRYVCDLADERIQKDMPSSNPPGVWGHERGMVSQKIFHNGLIEMSVGGACSVCDGNLIGTHPLNPDMIVQNYMWNAITSTGRNHNSSLQPESIGRACYEYGNYIHVSEQLITRTHRNTGGIVAVVFDTSNRGANYASGYSVDVFLEGNISIDAKDLLTFGDSTAAGDTYYQVDSVEPYFGDPVPPGLGPDDFYTLVTIYGAYPDDLTQWNGMYVWKLTRTIRGGRWLRYDLNWANMTVLHTSTRQLGYLRDGELIGKVESRTPKGAEFQVERLADDSNIWYIKLPFGAPYGLAEVRTAANQLLHVRSMDCSINPVVYPIPNESSLVYQVDGAGDAGNETWLIVHPSYVAAKVYVLYSYYADDCYVERFWWQDNVMAIDAGIGIRYKYDTVTNTILKIQDIRIGEMGLLTQPLILIEYSNLYYNISNPNGYFSVASPGGLLNHLDRLDIRNKRITELLAIVSQSFGQYIYLDVNNVLWIKNRKTGAYTEITSIRPNPELNTPIGSDSVRVIYNSGQAQDGHSKLPRRVDILEIDTYDHALWLAGLYRDNDTQDEIIIDIPITDDLEILSTIKTAYPEPILDSKVIYGQIIGKKYNLEEQQIQLRCRRLS